MLFLLYAIFLWLSHFFGGLGEYTDNPYPLLHINL